MVAAASVTRRVITPAVYEGQALEKRNVIRTWILRKIKGVSGREKTWTVLAGALVCLFSIAAMLLLFALNLRFNQRQIANTSFMIQTMVETEVHTTLRRLNAAGLNGCSDDALLNMRHVLFQSNFVKEVAYYEDGLAVCNTTNGRLESPYSLGEPDFELQYEETSEVWLNRRVDLEYLDHVFNAMIIRVGKYSFMYDSDTIFLGDGGPFLWKLVHVNPDTGEQTLINSLENVIRLSIPDFTPSPSIPALNFFACNPNVPEYCISLSASLKSLLRVYPQIFTLIGLLGLILGVATSVITRQALLARSKTPTRIKRAIKENAFSCYFQPIVDIGSSRIVGCEVLARLRDRYGTMNPDDFLKEIKQTRMTWVFTRQIIGKTFSLLEEQQALPDGFRVSLNIFPNDVNSGAVLELLEMPDILNSRFNTCLEIIEDELLDADKSRGILSSLAAAGFDIAIDDFGSGYSNLKHIAELNCTCLKVDRSFTMDINPHSLKTSLIPHMVSIASEIGVTLIAEGVETREQRDYLLNTGVRFGQGYYYSKPLDIDGFIGLAEEADPATVKAWQGFRAWPSSSGGSAPSGSTLDNLVSWPRTG